MTGALSSRLAAMFLRWTPVFALALSLLLVVRPVAWAQDALAHADAIDDLLGRWRTMAREHPLVGRMYQTVGDRLVARDVWREHGAEAIVSGGAVQTFLLIGEVHDNAEHHRAQSLLMAVLSASDPAAPTDLQPAVVMEMLAADQAQALADYLRAPQTQLAGLGAADRARRAPALAEGLGAAVGWGDTGWPAWETYVPIAEMALVQGRGIFAGDARRAVVRAVAKGGASAAAPDVLQRLKLDSPLPTPLAAALSEELRQSHCGLLPEAALTGMADAQRYRDASLAESLTEAGPAGAVLIAGNGHVRTDRGVPWYVRRRVRDAAIVSVMLLEVEDGQTDPEAYLLRDPAGKPAADYVLFTPRAPRKDPCEEMAARRAGKKG